MLCTAQDCSAGKKGSRKGKPLKQGSALAKFNDWFGSMSLMNTLYVWFPASWGPSVVEAISKRNQRWLQQHPVHRDPTMFNPLEVQNGIASRFFLLVAAWVRSERPSVSCTKVSAVSLGLANSCNWTNRNKFKQNSGSNKFLIAGDGKMKRMREP